MGQKFNFKRLDEPFEADWPVVVQVPQDGGKATPEEFMARFRVVRDLEEPPPVISEELASELKSAPEDIAPEEDATPEQRLTEARRLLRDQVLQAWRRWFVGFGKPTSEEDELTDDVLWHIVTTPYARRAVEAAYKTFCEGIAVKN